MWAKPEVVPPSIEQVRKHARVLVIDDLEFPAQKNFERDGYHFERWPEVQNLSQLTDGHYHLILLDIEGVGLNDSPEMQGLGILRQIKKTNPSQMVILYSAKPQRLSYSSYLTLADVVIEKGIDYVSYKEKVDELLLKRSTPSYFIAAMNENLGENAILAPKAVPKAMRAFRRGNATPFNNYIRDSLPDPQQADIIIGIIQVGLATVPIFTGA